MRPSRKGHGSASSATGFRLSAARIFLVPQQHLEHIENLLHRFNENPFSHHKFRP
jgi:hypothetical protein